MEKFKEDFMKIYKEEHGIVSLMVINLLFSIILFFVSIIKINPNSAVVKIGYGDIGGYRDGSWVNMLVYPLFAILFGILHSLLSVKIFHKRGGAMAKFFLITTTLLIFCTFVVLIRVTEGF